MCPSTTPDDCPEQHGVIHALGGDSGNSGGFFPVESTIFTIPTDDADIWTVIVRGVNGLAFTQVDPDREPPEIFAILDFLSARVDIEQVEAIENGAYTFSVNGEKFLIRLELFKNRAGFATVGEFYDRYGYTPAASSGLASTDKVRVTLPVLRLIEPGGELVFPATPWASQIFGRAVDTWLGWTFSALE